MDRMVSARGGLCWLIPFYRGTMRMARIRYDREMCYYHLMNRVAGEAGYFP